MGEKGIGSYFCGGNKKGEAGWASPFGVQLREELEAVSDETGEHVSVAVEVAVDVLFVVVEVGVPVVEGEGDVVHDLVSGLELELESLVIEVGIFIGIVDQFGIIPCYPTAATGADTDGGEVGAVHLALGHGIAQGAGEVEFRHRSSGNVEVEDMDLVFPIKFVFCGPNLARHHLATSPVVDCRAH